MHLFPTHRLAGAVLAVTMLTACTHSPQAPTPSASGSATPSGAPVPLAAPSVPTASGLGVLLDDRHSTRDYGSDPISLEQLSALLWAAYGIQSDGGRTVPSAGGIYPMEIHLLAGEVAGLNQGVYAYNPDAHQVVSRLAGDLRADLMAACLNQEWVGAAPLVIVVAGAPERLRGKYGDRSERYALLEAGHIGQNLALAAEALGLGMVTVGAFNDEAVSSVVGLAPSDQVYYVIPVGQPR